MKKLLLTVAVAAMFFSCENDANDNQNGAAGNEQTQNSASKPSRGLERLRQEAFDKMNLGGMYHYSAPQGLTISGDMLRGQSTSSIVIPPNALTYEDGTPINGYIYVDYVEVFTIEKMVSLNKPTMGFNPQTGERELLVSGGEFYLMIKDSNGNQVTLNQPIQVNIATNNSQANANGMLLWNGVTDPDGSFWWNNAAVSDVSFANGSPVFQEGNYYNILVNDSNTFGWYNCDKFWNDPRPKTDVIVQIPNGFDQSNSSVYIAFENEKNALMHLFTYDANNNMYGTPQPAIPDGIKGHIIFVGEQNGQYKYEIISTIITNSPVFNINPGNLITASNYQQLENHILSLP